MEQVLVVDDELIHRDTASRGLRRHGFAVATASNAGEAMARLAEGGVESVLVDVMMPGVCGLTLARWIHVRFPAVRVVLTSTYPISLRQLDRMGFVATSFVAKPAALPALAAALRGVTLQSSTLPGEVPTGAQA